MRPLLGNEVAPETQAVFHKACCLHLPITPDLATAASVQADFPEGLA